jgi:excisionase family DNA binding protein
MKIIVEGITLEEFFQRIEQIVEAQVQGKLPFQPVADISYLTIAETAKLLRVSKPTINQWIKDGFLQSHKIGNRVLFKRDEVDEAVTRISKHVRIGNNQAFLKNKMKKA